MRNSMRGLALCFSLASAAGGQAILGTYTAVPAAGRTGSPVTLVLQKDAQGKIGGSLSVNGTAFVVQGVMQGDDVAGTVSGSGMRSLFEAHREGTRLRMIVADVGADGKPDYANAREILMNVSDAAPVAQAVSQPSASAAGNPLAGGGTVDRFAGTFTGADVTLTLNRSGNGYAGTIKYRGTEYPAMARATGESLAGSFKVGAQSYDMTIVSTGDAKFVNLSTGGTTYMLARAATTGTGNPLAGGSATPSLAQTAQDQQLAQLLTSTAWCTFSFSGSGGSSGTSSSSRTVFSLDGTVTEGKKSESVYSGSAGTAFGSGSDAQRGKWKVSNGQLMLSADGVQWVPQRLKIADNGSGAPIITSGGKEYMRCK